MAYAERSRGLCARSQRKFGGNAILTEAQACFEQRDSCTSSETDRAASPEWREDAQQVWYWVLLP